MGKSNAGNGRVAIRYSERAMCYIMRAEYIVHDTLSPTAAQNHGLLGYIGVTLYMLFSEMLW